MDIIYARVEIEVGTPVTAGLAHVKAILYLSTRPPTRRLGFGVLG